MKTLISNISRFFAFISVLILLINLFPVWSSQEIENINDSDAQVSTLNPISNHDRAYWCDILGIFEETSLDEDGYLAKKSTAAGNELIHQRKGNLKAYLGDDNIITYQIFSGNIHYKNAIGTWDEFDTVIKENNIIPLGRDIRYDFANEANTLRTYLRNGYATSDSILTAIGDDYLAWEPIDMTYIDQDGDLVEISAAANSEAVVQDNRILYPATYKNTADLFTVKEHSLKHEIILDCLPTLPESIRNKEFIKSNPLKLSSLSYAGYLTPSQDLRLYIAGEAQLSNQVLETKSAIEFKAVDGDNCFTLPPPVAYELNDPSNQISCKYSLEPIGEKYKLSIQTPYDWLTEPTRCYPVVIDPTVYYDFQPDEFESNDTFIAYGYGDPNIMDDNYGTDEKLIIGGWGLNNSVLLRFDISTLPPKEINFDSALLKLNTATHGGFDPTTAEVAVHEMEEEWSEGTGTLSSPTNDGATWLSPKGAGTTWAAGQGGSYALTPVNITWVAGPGEEKKFNVADLVTGWRDNPATNFGLMLKYRDPQAFGGKFKAFYSSKAIGADFRPKLEVAFLNTPPTIKGPNRYQWNEDEDIDPTIILLDDHFQDADLHVLNITLWTGSAWGQKFECPIFDAILWNYGNPSNPDYKCHFNLKPNQHGSQQIKFSATDQISVTEAHIEIDIRAVNDAPILHRIGNHNAIEEEYIYIPLEVTEVEGETIFWDTNVSDYEQEGYMGDRLEIVADSEEPNNPKKKQIQYFPDNNDAPRVYVSIIVYDQTHDPILSPSIDWENITINVTNVNDKPILTKIEYTLVAGRDEYTVTIDQGKKKSLKVQAYDDDIINGDNLEFYSDAAVDDDFTITELTGADIPQDFRGENRQTALVEFIPDNSHVGEYVVTINVKDKDNTTDKIRIKYKVNDVNDLPEILSSDMSEPSDGIEYTNRDSINFSCEVDDLDLELPPTIFKEKLNITWFNNLSGNLMILGYGNEIKNQTFKAGDYQIELVVSDLRGGKTKKLIPVKIEKSITLQNDCTRNYTDDSTMDDIEYSYNYKTKKFTMTQGIYGEIDLVDLMSYYDSINEDLVIKLKFATTVVPPVEFDVRVYIVKLDHKEPEPNYKVEYTTNFYEKELYQPTDTKYYGFFTMEDGEFVDNEFIVRYSLADLEEGVPGLFESVDKNFQVFATVRWKVVEDRGNVENFRYDSIGYISAYAPPPGTTTTDGGDKKGGLDFNIILIILVVIIVIIVLAAVGVINKKKKKKEVIDFSKTAPPSRVPLPSQQIPQMFMTPFEQQFKSPTPIPPQSQQMPMPTQPGAQPMQYPAQTTTLPTQAPTQPQIPQLPPHQEPSPQIPPQTPPQTPLGQIPPQPQASQPQTPPTQAPPPTTPGTMPSQAPQPQKPEQESQ